MHVKTRIMLLGLSIFLIAAASCSPARGTIQAAEIRISTTLADKDAGVASNQPDTNSGSSASIGAGYPNVEPYVYSEGFIHFNLADKPTNLISAEIRLFIMVSDAGHIRFTTVDAEWGEYTVTWNNKPAGSALITDLDLTTDPGYRYINITDFIAGRNDISIRLNATSKAEFVSITVVSREETMNLVYRPVIIWTYSYTPGGGDVPPPAVDGYASVLVLLGIATGAAIVVKILTIKNRLPKK
jgi:hypothetical protein